MRILKYLQFSWDYELHHIRDLIVLEGYSGYIGYLVLKPKSRSCYVFTLGGKAIL